MKARPILMSGAPPSNARLLAELQAVRLGIHMVGLDRLPEVMNPERHSSIQCALHVAALARGNG